MINLLGPIKSLVKNIIAFFKAQQFKRAVRRGELNGQLIILMYHRVLPKTDPRLENEEPGMYVTPDTFDMHLCELKKFAQFIHIEDWLKLSRNGELSNTPYVAITFDDGWADNYEFAFPVLKKHKTPACIFLATDYIGSNTVFWPERLTALLNNYAQHKAPLDAFFNSLGASIQTERLNRKDKDYAAELINTAKNLNDDQIKSALEAIEKSAMKSDPQVNTKQEMLSWEQVKILSEAGVKIGGHTRSHLRLNNKASVEQIEHEVKGCHIDIEEKLSIPPTLFCYPNGDTSNDALSSVKKTFRAAVTTNKGINGATQDKYLLKRVGVHEDASNSPLKLLGSLIK